MSSQLIIETEPCKHPPPRRSGRRFQIAFEGGSGPSGLFFRDWVARGTLIPRASHHSGLCSPDSVIKDSCTARAAPGAATCTAGTAQPGRPHGVGGWGSPSLSGPWTAILIVEQVTPTDFLCRCRFAQAPPSGPPPESSGRPWRGQRSPGLGLWEGTGLWRDPEFPLHPVLRVARNQRGEHVGGAGAGGLEAEGGARSGCPHPRGGSGRAVPLRPRAGRAPNRSPRGPTEPSPCAGRLKSCPE